MGISTCQQNLPGRHDFISVLTFRFWLAVLFCLCPEQLQLAKAQSSNANSQADLVTQELRYHAPGAAEVWLLWGINGWQPIPDAVRPPGTFLIPDRKMQTPLVRKGNTFTTTLRVPPGTVIDHGFLITKTEGGTVVNIWEPSQPYTGVRHNGRIEIESTATVVPTEQYTAWLAGQRSDIPLVSQELRYHAPEAAEVWLLWGINGWQPIPDAVRPPGTFLIPDRKMQTPLVRKGNTFTTTLRVPPGTVIDHGFLITKTKGGTAVNIWETGRPYTDVRHNGRIEIESTATVVPTEQYTAWLAGQRSDIPLVSQELRYRAPEAGDVWLLWGINSWQPLPLDSRPLRTVLKNGIMNTEMTREGKTFITYVTVPPGTVINYKIFIAKADESPPSRGEKQERSFPIAARLDGTIEIESAVSAVAMEQHKAWPSGRLADLSLVAQEIRYRIAGAEEVWLVWGINGWQAIPEAARPAGTVLKDNRVMHTRMVRKGDTFATTLRVPRGTGLDYGFLITKTSRGAPVNIWQDYNGQAFWKLVRVTGSLEEKATVTVVTLDQRKAWLAGQAADLPLVTQEIRYRAPGAAEVWLAWGLEGWQAIPDAARPPGTVLKNGKMHTHMVREGNRFTTTVRVPPGTVQDFSFLIAKTEEGTTVDIRQEKDGEGRALSRVVAFDARMEVQSTAWLTVQAADLSLVAQEIRYRIAGAEEVWLVWGINGWQAIPEAARPAGTVLKDNRVMHTRMVRKGDTFATTLRVPRGTGLDYGFLITKTSRGVPVNIWQDYNGQDFRKLVRVTGSLEEKATVTVVTLDQRKAWLAGQAADLPLVTQEIRYRAPGAAEVWLAWGLEGWQTIPDAARPPGTVLKNGKMHTHMVREGNIFTTTLRVPPGTGLDCWVFIAKTEEGATVDIRQEKDGEGRALSRVVAFDSRMEVQSQSKSRY